MNLWRNSELAMAPLCIDRSREKYACIILHYVHVCTCTCSVHFAQLYMHLCILGPYSIKKILKSLLIGHSQCDVTVVVCRYI